MIGLKAASEVAASYLAIANTPLFVASKIRSDSRIQALASLSKGEDALKALKAAIEVEPKALNEEVVPYLLLTMLSMMADRSLLSEAVKIRAPKYRWYDEIAAFLAAGLSNTTITGSLKPPHPSLVIPPRVASKNAMKTIGARRK